MSPHHGTEIRRNKPLIYQRIIYSTSPLAYTDSLPRSLDLRTFFNGIRPSADKKGKHKEHQSKRHAPQVVDVPLGIATPGDAVGEDDGVRPYVLFLPPVVYDDEFDDDEPQHAVAQGQVTYADAVGEDDGVRPYVLFFCLSWFQKKKKPDPPPVVYDDEFDDHESEHAATDIPIPTIRSQPDTRKEMKLTPKTFFQPQPEAGPSRLAPSVDTGQEATRYQIFIQLFDG
ncbi:hypothetical protein P692DRAFT_20883779 [Suillus brevipes Sb2]|nr:hypothetical protein P692DRAFT_20883779 [Suillus brevipes Sb2]